MQIWTHAGRSSPKGSAARGGGTAQAVQKGARAAAGGARAGILAACGSNTNTSSQAASKPAVTIGSKIRRVEHPRELYSQALRARASRST